MSSVSVERMSQLIEKHVFRRDADEIAKNREKFKPLPETDDGFPLGTVHPYEVGLSRPPLYLRILKYFQLKWYKFVNRKTRIRQPRSWKPTKTTDVGSGVSYTDHVSRT